MSDGVGDLVRKKGSCFRDSPRIPVEQVISESLRIPRIPVEQVISESLRIPRIPVEQVISESLRIPRIPVEQVKFSSYLLFSRIPENPGIPESLENP